MHIILIFKFENFLGISFFDYFTLELMHGYLVDKNDTRYLERRERVYTFLKQPIEIEKVS